MRLENNTFYRTRNGNRMRVYGGWADETGSGWLGRGDNADTYYYLRDGTYRHDNPHLDIVSIWTDEPASPVRTVTRSTKHLEPETYGRVIVSGGSTHGVGGPWAQIRLSDVDSDFSVADLRAAATVFTQLADALDEQGGAS